ASVDGSRRGSASRALTRQWRPRVLLSSCFTGPSPSSISATSQRSSPGLAKSGSRCSSSEKLMSQTPRSKSCAAFANTAGGLLLVGVADGSDELVGTEQESAEAQVWVKDVLRGHLLPLPP